MNVSLPKGQGGLAMQAIQYCALHLLMPYLNAQLTELQGCCFLLLGICQLKDAMGIAPAAFIVWALPDLVHAELQLPSTHARVMSPESCK